MIHLELEDREVDFIANVLSSVPTGQSVQAGMTHLLPKLAEQAQESLERERVAAAEVVVGIEQAIK